MADGQVTIKVTVDGKEVAVQLGKIEDQIEKTGDTASEASEKATRDTKAMVLALSTVTASLVAAGLKAYDMASAYDAAFAKTRTIMDDSVMSAGEMRSAVLELSKDSAMAAEDVSDAVYQAISGSVDTADAVQFVDKANKLAVAGFTSLTNATDVLTTTLNAYHMSAERVEGISNVLIRTQNLGKTSVDELAASMGKSIATGSAYNVSLENLSTAYVELTRNGIATAESTTYINSMLNELGDSGKTVGKILQEQTGKSFGQLMQDGWSLADVLGVLLDSVNGNTEALMGLWGSQEAGKAANAIVSQSIEDFNQVLATMNAEMAGTTGTTEQAYETMTSTSEFIDRRLTNSVKNLAIAYGEMLAPPMDAIKSLGADILEGLTDLINKSPAAASAIAAVSTGVTVLAGGLAALLIVEKVKAAFGGFNALLAANPVLLVVAGISALAIGIGTLIANTKEENKHLEEFNEKLRSINDSFNTDIATVEVASDRANAYIDRLEELDAVGTKTTEQQEEYHATLEKLVETVPELAELIDLETDTIKGGTDALRDNTAEWEKNARAQAYQKYLTEYTEAHTQALIDQKKAELELKNAKKKYYEDTGKDYDEMLKSLEKYRAELNSLKKGLGEGDYEDLPYWADSQSGFSADDLKEAEDALESYMKDLADADETVNAASEALNGAREVVEELTEAEIEAGDAAGSMGDEMQEAADGINAAGDAAGNASATIDEITAKTPEITDAMQSWADKYGDLYKAAKESLEKQFKLWDEVEAVTAVKVKDANKGIQSQIEYWQDYNKNLAEIKNSGIQGIEELYQFISDGSADSVAMAAGIAEEIRKGNQPAVEDMIGLYEDLAAAQESTAESMFEMQADMDNALAELVGAVDTAVGDMELPDAAWAAAHETVLAYARGLYDGTGDVEAAAQAVQRAAVSGLKNAGNKGGGTSRNAYASGTNFAAAGYALVGEEGPELIYLRGGERILNAEETQRALRGIYDLPLATSSYSGPAAPASVGGGPGDNRQLTVVVPVEVDGRELARVTAQAMGEEMMFGGY